MSDVRKYRSSLAIGFIHSPKDWFQCKSTEFLRPAKEILWSDVFLEAFFFSSINVALLFPLLSLIPLDFEGGNLYKFWIILLVYLFIAPSLWAWSLTALFCSRFVAERIKIPYPSTWDYFFDNNSYVFLIVHLNNEDIIGGFWSENPYATLNGDLYMELLYTMREDGTFGEPIPFSKGLLIRKDGYSHIEILEVPPQNGGTNENE